MNELQNIMMNERSQKKKDYTLHNSIYKIL